MKKQNLKEVLKTLIKREDEPSFCYTFYWTNLKVKGIDDVTFFEEMKEHKEKGNPECT